jgi:hypothetical protein
MNVDGAPVSRPVNTGAVPRLLPGLGRFAPVALVAAGLLWSLAAALDPAIRAGQLAGPLLTLLGCLAEGWWSGRWRRWAVPVVLAAGFGAGAWAEPDLLRADVPVYYCYVRSLAFDHDLDFANEWEHWGFDELPVTATGHRRNQGSIGPSLFWAPFFALAHAYVVAGRALGRVDYAADGFSVPYLRSTLPGTVTVAVLGGLWLVRALARRVRRAVALLSVAGALFTSSVVFYVLVQPGMAHGIAFGLAAATVAAWLEAEDSPSLGSWVALGAVTGLLILVRFQAVAYAILPVCLGVAQLRSRRARFSWILRAFAASLAAVLPQVLAWWVIYGSPFVLGPGMRRSGGTWLHISSPRFLSVLFSADHGFFSWTPGMLLGAAGLALGLRRWRLLAAAGLLTLLVTAWLNGSLVGWNGSDAFGARRFDTIVPLVALGYATLLEGAIAVPLAAPAAILAALVLWNLGLISLWRDHAFPYEAAADEVLARQASLGRRRAESWLGYLAGPSGRALAYDYFVGRYLFWSTARDGRIDMATPERTFLTGAWSPPRNEAGFPRYREILGSRACVRVPLLDPVDVPFRIEARAHPHRDLVTAVVTLNGRALVRWPLGDGWEEHRTDIPERLLVRGENLICLEFEGKTGSPLADVRSLRLK